MSRTFRLRHEPKIGALKFTDARMHKYRDRQDEEAEFIYAHELLGVPCVKGQTFYITPYPGANWQFTRYISDHRMCVTHSDFSWFGTRGMYDWVKSYRVKHPSKIANLHYHHNVGYSAGATRKYWRTTRNREFRRKNRRYTQIALMLNPYDGLVPGYKKRVNWDCS